MDCCPTRVFDFDENTRSIVINNPADCMFCRECLYTTEEFRKNPEDALGIEVQHSEDTFTFTVETTGSLLAREVLEDAIAVLSDKLMTIQKAIPQLLHGDM